MGKKSYIPEDLRKKLLNAYMKEGANEYTAEKVLNKWFKENLKPSHNSSFIQDCIYNKYITCEFKKDDNKCSNEIEYKKCSSPK